MRAHDQVLVQIQKLRNELHRRVVGYDEVIDDLLLALICEGHILLEGVPGVAKTTLAKTFTQASGLGFRRVQFTPDLLPADITGHYYFDQQHQEFTFRQGPIFANVLLVDEINRAPPKTQAALLEAMEERQVTVEGETTPLPNPFLLVATLNPRELEGVYRLPEALLDRFLIRSQMSYLEEEQEMEMLLGKLRDAPEVRSVLSAGFFQHARSALDDVHADEDLVRYVHRIGLATRNDPRMGLGASPRSLEYLLQATRAQALIEGRTYTIPDDVKRMAPRVLAHRLALDVDAELDGAHVDTILADVLDDVPVPK